MRHNRSEPEAGADSSSASAYFEDSAGAQRTGDHLPRAGVSDFTACQGERLRKKYRCADVERRHAANGNRYVPSPDINVKGDTIEVAPDKRTYVDSRLMEQNQSVVHETYIGRDGNNYRGNRQNPMAASKITQYEGVKARLEGC
jgi:hypothetical protein